MIPHNRPTVGAEERRAVGRVIDSSWLRDGREVPAFEDELANYLGMTSGGVVATSSGSTALLLALLCLDPARVQLPAYGCSSLRQSVIMSGREWEYLDVCPGSVNACFSGPADREQYRSLAVSTFGIPVFIAEGDLSTIDDAAQGFGGFDSLSRRLGSRGAVGILSFSATKVITSAGQGGAVVCSSNDLLEAVRDRRNFDARGDDMARLNCQMTEMQAAFGRAQLRRMDDFLGRREEIFGRYASHGLNLVGSNLAPGQVARYRAVVLTDERNRLIRALESGGVKAIAPYTTDEVSADLDSLPHTRDLIRRAVSLPIYPSLANAEVDRIAQLALKALQ